MKKRILGLALIAMSMAAIGANAQTTTTTDNSNCTKTECTANQKSGKNNGAKIRSNAAFDKMNLSADQKAKLQALEQKKVEARKANAEARKAQKQQGNADARAAREAEKKQYLQDLKAIVGPDNYVIFLEDYYVQDNLAKRVKASPDKMAKARNDMKADRNKNRKDGKRRAGSAAEQNTAQSANS